MARAVIYCWSDSAVPPTVPEPDDYVICADCGYEYALRCGVRPDLFVGDRDSCAQPVDGAIPAITLDVRKDDTDTHFAVDLALKKGYKQILIAGGIGGPRIDHMFANIQTLRHIYACGARGSISDGRTAIRFLNAPARLLIPYDARLCTVSIVPLCDLKDLCVEGLSYEAAHLDLPASRPMAVSNEPLAGRDGQIRLGGGQALVFLIYNRR